MPLLQEAEWGLSKWAVWHITESLEELYQLLPYGGRECKNEAEKRFANEGRKIEFAAVRVLLYTLLGKQPFISYLPSGRPVLEQSEYNISISHTKKYAAIALSKYNEVGVDIERYRNEVERLSPRFVRCDEQAPTQLTKLIHWSAKETVFKLIDQEGVDFLQHLHIKPFRVISNRGEMLLQEFRTPQQQTFEVKYEIEAEFVLTFAEKRVVGRS